MQYREYGKTGEKVSMIGMGGMRFDDRDNLAKCARVLLRGLEGGINYFDTAPGYPRSEEAFGAAMADMKKTGIPFSVSSKTFASDEKGLRADLERSLQRMHVDVIDFYHVWCVITPEAMEQRRVGGALEAMKKVQKEGLVRHICLSTHMAGADIASELKREPMYAGVLLGFNGANFPYRYDGIAAAAETGRGVVTMNPLGGGIIPNHPERFEYLKIDPKESVVEAALRFNLSHPQITVALVGVRNVQDMDDVLGFAERFNPLTDAQLQTIKRNAGKGYEGLCTLCNYCRQCPAEIQVMRFMDSHNLALLDPDNPEKAIVQLRNDWGIDNLDALDQCLECRKCEEACTQHLPILERFEALREIYAGTKAKEAAQKKP